VALNQIPKENLIYLDESGFDLNMKKEYGWKAKGHRLYDNKSGNRKNKRITVISAYSNQTKQLIAPMYFEGNTDTEIFNQWIEEFLIPELKPNQTVILDNAAFHKSQKTMVEWLTFFGQFFRNKIENYHVQESEEQLSIRI
jgi:hypothetical protein